MILGLEIRCTCAVTLIVRIKRKAVLKMKWAGAYRDTQGLKALVAILYVDVYPQPKKHKFNTKAVADGGRLVGKSIGEGGLATTYTRMHKRDGLSSCRSSGSPSVQL